MWGLDEIKDYLRSNLKPARYGHVLGVVNTAIKLAETYGEDKEKAEIAALCHDVAKNMSNEELRKGCAVDINSVKARNYLVYNTNNK